MPRASTLASVARPLILALALAACADPATAPLAGPGAPPLVARGGVPAATIEITDVAATTCREPGGALRVSGSATLRAGGRVPTENLILAAAIQHKPGPGPFADLAGTAQQQALAALDPGASVVHPFSVTFAEPASGAPYRLALRATVTNHPARPGQPFGPPTNLGLGSGPFAACAGPAPAPNAAPAVTIASPTDGAVLPATSAVSLSASASDAEDGDLTAAIEWSVDGVPVATGGSASPVLAPGSRVIAASVTDGDGETSMTSVTILVNAAPVVAITSPVSGASVAQGASVSLAGSASDANDGDLSAQLQWASSLDGSLGSGASLALSTLSAGTHTITASVTDPHGAPAQAQVQLTVEESSTCTNVVPGAEIETQADVTDLAGVCEITGFLWIRQASGTSDPIVSLEPLSELRRVGSGVLIEATELTSLAGLERLTVAEGPFEGSSIQIEWNPKLATLDGLATLASGAPLSKGYHLEILGNPMLTDMSAIARLLDPAGSTWNRVQVSYNDILPSLSGLERVREVGTMNIVENFAMTSVAGLANLQRAEFLQLRSLAIPSLALPSLEEVENLDLERLDAISAISLSIPLVGNRVGLERNSQLQTFALSIGAGEPSFEIHVNPLLSTVGIQAASGWVERLSLASLPALQSVNVNGLRVRQDLSIGSTGLAAISTFGTMTGLTGSFLIVDNPQLSDVANLGTITSVLSLTVMNNPKLCATWDHVSRSGGTISGNCTAP